MQLDIVMSERAQALTCRRLAALLAGLQCAGAFMLPEGVLQLQSKQLASARSALQPQGLKSSPQQHSVFAHIAPPPRDYRTRSPLHLRMLPEDAMLLLSMPDPLLLQHPELALLFPAGIIAFFPVELALIVLRLVQV